MQPEEQRAERSRDLERVLTYVDAIAAVAITLLILPLVDLAGEIRSEHDSVSALIRSHAGEFWGFALSFVVIARLWFSQHRLMRPVVTANRPLLFWLLLWTFAIVFLPFPTALLSIGGDQPITKVLYIGTLALSSSAGGPGRGHRRSFCRGPCGFASRSIDRLLPAAPLGGHRWRHQPLAQTNRALPLVTL